MKTKLNTLMALGVLVLVVPFFGIPLVWKQWILAIIGAVIIWLAFSLRALLPREVSETTPVYTENGNRE